MDVTTMVARKQCVSPGTTVAQRAGHMATGHNHPALHSIAASAD